MSSPFSARSCLAKPKSQMRMDSGFPDSSTYRMLLGFRSRCTTCRAGASLWPPWRRGCLPPGQARAAGENTPPGHSRPTPATELQVAALSSRGCPHRPGVGGGAALKTAATGQGQWSQLPWDQPWQLQEKPAGASGHRLLAAGLCHGRGGVSLGLEQLASSKLLPSLAQGLSSSLSRLASAECNSSMQNHDNAGSP